MYVESLHYYPLKSAAGLPLEEATVERRGITGDRRWMVVDLEGKFVTQRTRPRMALIHVHTRNARLVLEAPGIPRIEAQAGMFGRLMVGVWGDLVEAERSEEAADVWLSTVLEMPARLVYLPEDVHRPVNPLFGAADDEVSFADGYPLMLAGAASLVDLNDRLSRPVPMNRFRPNVVVDGADAFAEDAWRRIRIGELDFRVAKPCERCSIITVDQGTGDAGVEPTRTLATYRRRDGKVYFGQNLIPDGEGVIRVGEEVTVLE